MFRTLGIFLFIFLIAFSPLKAQEGTVVPALFDQFFNNYYLVNPANEDSAASLRLRIGNRSLTGIFAGVNRIYFDADAGFRAKRPDRFHSVGIQAVNSRDGEFFSRSRLYGRYSWRTGLSPKASLSAGIAIGIVNYAFRPSQASPGGSSVVTDGNAGLWYLRSRTKIGLSMQQMLEQKLRPINQEFRLNRFYNFNISNLFPLGPYLNLTTHIYTRLQKQEPVTLDLAGILEIQQRLEAGFNYRHLRGVAFMAGIKRIHFGALDLSIMASYMASTKKVTMVTDNVVEFHLSLRK